MANLELENDFAQQFVDEYEIMSLNEVDSYDLAYFVDENWEEITGLFEGDKNIDSDFPAEVEDICSELEVSMEDFENAWKSFRESIDDWKIPEDEEEDDMEWDSDEDDSDDYFNTEEDED